MERWDLGKNIKKHFCFRVQFHEDTGNYQSARIQHFTQSKGTESFERMRCKKTGPAISDWDCHLLDQEKLVLQKAAFCQRININQRRYKAQEKTPGTRFPVSPFLQPLEGNLNTMVVSDIPLQMPSDAWRLTQCNNLTSRCLTQRNQELKIPRRVSPALQEFLSFYFFPAHFAAIHVLFTMLNDLICTRVHDASPSPNR